MDHATLVKALGAAGVAVLLLSGLGGMLPWKSRRLSTPAIQRRVYWSGTIAGAVVLFVSQLPDWRSGLIITFAVAFVMVLSAYRFTSHIKLGGRIYEFMRDPRQPDPPPALRSDGGDNWR